MSTKLLQLLTREEAETLCAIHGRVADRLGAASDDERMSIVITGETVGVQHSTLQDGITMATRQDYRRDQAKK